MLELGRGTAACIRALTFLCVHPSLAAGQLLRDCLASSDECVGPAQSPPVRGCAQPSGWKPVSVIPRAWHAISTPTQRVTEQLGHRDAQLLNSCDEALDISTCDSVSNPQTVSVIAPSGMVLSSCLW